MRVKTGWNEGDFGGKKWVNKSKYKRANMIT